MTPSTLDSTFARFRATGDPVHLGRVFDQVAPGLLRLARRMTADAAADDLVQETFLTALEKAEAWDPSRPVGPWLAGILANRARTARRRAGRDVVSDEAAAGVRAEARGDQLEGAELERAVDRALKTLPRNERAAVAGRLFDGLSGPELAERFGITASTARTRLSRGMQRLRAALPAGLTPAVAGSGASLGRIRRVVLEAAGAPGGALAHGGVNAGALAAVIVAGIGFTVGGALLWRGAEPEVERSAPEEVVRLDQDVTGEVLAAAPRGEAERVAAAEATEAPSAAAEGTVAWLISVVDEATGQPLAGIPVEASHGRTGARRRTVVETDATGAAAFELDAGARRVLWTALPTEATALVRQQTSEQGPGELTLAVSPGGTLAGRVVDLEGQAIAGATVQGWCSSRRDGEPHRLAVSGAEGSFTLEHLGHQFVVGAETDGFALSVGLRGEFKAGETVTGMEVVMDRAVQMTGTVRSRDGDVVAGAELSASPSYGTGNNWIPTPEGRVRTLKGTDLEAKSGADGRFSIGPVPASRGIYLIARREPFLIDRAWRNAKEGPVEIVLDPGLEMSGLVLDAEGRPAEGARVRFGPYSGDLHTTTNSQITEADGRFSFVGVRPDDFEYGPTPRYVTVVHAAHAVEVVQPIELEQDGPNEEIRIELVPEARLRGRLVDAAGEPIAGAKLRAGGPRRYSPPADFGVPPSWEFAVGLDEGSTNEEGLFAFSHLHPGPVTLFVQHPDLPESTVTYDLQTSDELQEVVLGADAMTKVILVGTITDGATGEPVDQVTMTPFLDGSGRGRLVDTQEGRYRIEGVDPESERIAVRAEGYAYFSASPALPERGEQRFDVVLYPDVSMDFRVVDESGELRTRSTELRFATLEGESLMVRSGPRSHSGSYSAGQKGQGTVQGLPACPVRVTVESGRETQTFTVDLSIEAAREQEFVMATGQRPVPVARLLFFRRPGQGHADLVRSMLKRLWSGTEESFDPDDVEAFATSIEPPALPFQVLLAHDGGRDTVRLQVSEGGEYGIEIDLSTWSRTGPGSSSGSSGTEPTPYAASTLRLLPGTWSVTVMRGEEPVMETTLQVEPSVDPSDRLPVLIEFD